MSLKRHIFHSWWVLAFWLGCGIVLERENSRYDEELGHLTEKINEFLAENNRAEKKLHELLREVNSQSDPSWVEMTLMKELGMVPEGQIKVLFRDKPRQE